MYEFKAWLNLHRNVFIGVLISILLLIIMLVIANPQEEHCFADLQPANTGDPSIYTVQYRCFATEAESLYAGSHGKIQVSANASRDEIDRAIQEYNASLDSQ